MILFIVTDGAVPPVSNWNPAGASRMIVPAPIAPVEFSEMTGPVIDVYAPEPDALLVPAEIEVPPVAAVIATATEVNVIGLLSAVTDPPLAQR